MTSRETKHLAFRFVLIVGITNLFADMTYEGLRGVSGPFLGSLGASATIVGFVAGAGELLGYGLRSVSGFYADKSHRYWPIIFVGYIINMLAVPALALAGNWPMAAGLIIAERTGRAIRRPSVEAMISHAGKTIGRGWVFGLNEGIGPGRRNDWAAYRSLGSIPARKLSLRIRLPFDSRPPLPGHSCNCESGLSAPRRAGETHGTFSRNEGILESVLDLSRRRHVDCLRICGFFIDCLSL
jgi:hypothetical protein